MKQPNVVARDRVLGLAGSVDALAVLMEVVVVELHGTEARNERVEDIHCREGTYRYTHTHNAVCMIHKVVRGLANIHTTRYA